MSWFRQPGDAAQDQAAEAARNRAAAWEAALAADRMPEFVDARLQAARDGSQPWMATMTAAELLLSRSHGIRPLATVTGTCWFHYGRSWTEGHATGWRTALNRLRAEAVTAGANAVVDVRMRTSRARMGASMDYTLTGTAIRVEGLPASALPVVATTPALEFVRLLEMGIVPVGLAVGACYNTAENLPAGMAVTNYGNGELREMGAFWQAVRRLAHAELRNDARQQGGGVLAHTHFSQLLRIERSKQQPYYLGRHIVIGTVVDTPRGAKVPHGIVPVVDLRDDASPLGPRGTRANNSLGHLDREGPI